MSVDLRRRTEQTVGELQGGHFQADKQHRLTAGDRYVLGDVHRERRFPHTRASGENDQLGVVQAAAQRVEVGEARLHAAEGLLVLHAGIHPHERLFEHVTNRLGFRSAATFENREDFFFRPAKQRSRLVG